MKTEKKFNNSEIPPRGLKVILVYYVTMSYELKQLMDPAGSATLATIQFIDYAK